jgi:hypothetical protein
MTATKTPTPWAAVAAAVRRELKARRGELGIPAQATVRVVSSGFAGGASVDVRLSGIDTFVWTTAERDGMYHRAGDKVLTDAARALGDRLAEVIRVCRDAADVGYIWGAVDHDAVLLGTVAQRGWTPGQD